MIDSDFALIDLVTGYQAAATISAALETGVFDALSDSLADAETLAAELDADAGSLEALLNALSAIGLAQCEDGGYATTPFVKERLADGGDMAHVVKKEAFFARAWQDLATVISTGQPALMSWQDRLSGDPETAHSFLVALDVLARVAGPPIASLDVLAPNKRILDVGGGLGTYARQLAAAGSTVVVVDLPQVLTWVEETDGVEYRSADVDSHPTLGVATESFDAILVSHMLHDRTRSDCSRLLEAAYRVVRVGGDIVVNDFAGDSGPGAFGPLFDVMMRVETGAAAHPLDELIGLVEGAGFVEVHRRDFDEPLTVIVGRKPN